MENSSPKQQLTIISTSFTDKGLKRHNNEDFVIGFEPQEQEEFDRSGSLYIVADGVGGARKGERASEYAAKKILYDYYQPTILLPKQRLSTIIQDVSKEIYDYSTTNDLPRMASTLVAAVVHHDKLIIANVGDSRAYLIRKGSVTQITRDHNLAEELIRNGSMSLEEAEHSKAKNTLLRSLGGESEVEVDLFGEFDLFEGDLVLLCTDGLSRYVTPEKLASLSSSGSIEEIGQHMVDFANDSGGVDNISLYLIKAQREQERIFTQKSSRKLRPVTWDELQTQPVGLQYRNGSRLVKSVKSFQATSKILWGLTVLALVVGSTLFVIQGRKSNLVGNPNNKAIQSSVTNSPPESTSPLAFASEQDKLPTQESVASETPTSIVINENTATIGEGLLATATSESTPTVEIPTSGIGSNACVYQLVSGDNATSVYAKFNLSTQGVLFKEFDNCSVQENTCSGPLTEIGDPNSLRVGFILAIPEVTTQEICRSVENAYWVTIK
ncbi:MAG TPA: PP2C family serine/threonine-protein phosphatase [Anaerolineaceae bacterium]|nr:PP2C family serine/threonine-protein phosphatase [Anaerolineaceae bacterium]